MTDIAPDVARELPIDEEELAELALTLGSIPSPAGREGEAGEYVHQWLVSQGLRARRIGMLPDRFNVLGTLPGTKDGLSVMFNSHLDTGKNPDDSWSLRDAGAPIYNSAWRSGRLLYGEGVVNDKGPMAAWLIMLKALRDAEVELPGDVLVSAVCGEIGLEPVDEFEAPAYVSKELGARYLIQHGGVADYCVNAEGTGFRTGWIEPGKAFFKITVFGGPQRYTPFADNSSPVEASENAIVRAAAVIPVLHDWARRYEERFRYEAEGGTIVPKAVIGAIRGGNPYHVTRTSELCALYLDVRIVPGQDVLAIRAELRRLLRELGMEGEVELFVYRLPHEAREPGLLLEAIRQAHQDEFGSPPDMAPSPFVSMWRDLNPFNEMGIPCITYGPGTSVEGEMALSLDDLVRTAGLYASIAIQICSQPRPSMDA